MPIRLPRVFRRLAALFAWDARDRDMDDEMRFHLESLVEEHQRGGISRPDAERAARRRFGDVRRLKERGHDVRTTPGFEQVLRDVRHMARGLRKNPGFTLAVVLTLAIGIGGNAAIFSVVDQLLLRPLPYPAGDRLLTLYETFEANSAFAGTAPRRLRNSVSPANWLDWQRDSRTLEALAAWRPASVTLTGAGEPIRLDAQLVSSEFFPLLGVRPLLGRTVTPDDDRPNAPRVAVLSHQLWQSRFGGDASVVGRTVQLNDNAAEVLGVMPAGFAFVDQNVDLWMAYRLDRGQAWRETAGRFMNVVARRAPDASAGAAEAELRGIASRLASTHAFNKNTSIEMVPLREELTGQVHTSLLVLYAAVGVLLAIACFNVANLLLARASTRRREIAIRTSLGAGRLAIVRQLLVESLLLATAGGVLGVALAHWSLDALMAFAPPDLLRVPELFIDRRVLFYALFLSTLTGITIGLVPALLVARESLTGAARASGPTVTHAPRIRQALVVCQVAMTVVLLCGAGLLVRTVMALDRVSTGFDKQDVLTMEVALPPARYAEERRVVFYQQAVEALRALPGVDAAAAADSLAIIGSPRGGTVFHRLGTPQRPVNESPATVVRVVTPGYFRTLRVPILRGREFAPADGAEVGFVVNDAFARAYLADGDPLQARISVFMRQENPYLPILGVIGNVNEGSIRDGMQPTVFYSHRLMPETAMTLVVRTSRPAALAAPAVDAIHRIDRGLAVTRIRTFERALAESVARERLNALVSGSFAVSGLLLASLGLYALLAFLVAERTKEIGIRIALGAPIGRVKRAVVAAGLRLVLIGAALGVAVSAVLLRSVRTLLFGVAPHDVSTYAAVLTLLAAVAVLASYLPARWAARVEPLTALRHE